MRVRGHPRRESVCQGEKPGPDLEEPLLRELIGSKAYKTQSEVGEQQEEVKVTGLKL